MIAEQMLGTGVSVCLGFQAVFSTSSRPSSATCCTPLRRCLFKLEERPAPTIPIQCLGTQWFVCHVGVAMCTTHGDYPTLDVYIYIYIYLFNHIFIEYIFKTICIYIYTYIYIYIYIFIYIIYIYMLFNKFYLLYSVFVVFKGYVVISLSYPIMT